MLPCLTAFDKGVKAEEKVWQLFRQKGFVLLARRFKTPQGEIDLIVARGKVLVFVEVKCRGRLMQALEALTPGQKKRLHGAAQVFLQGHEGHAWQEVRFDMVAVDTQGAWRYCPHIFREPCQES